jgi:pimeloyl-ACP methyl ester carboxylesterase
VATGVAVAVLLPPLRARTALGSVHDLEAMAADSGDMRRRTNVQVPTLLMQGADTWDPMPTAMDELAAALPHVQRAIWTGQAHFATSTAHGLVADELRRFLRSHDQPAARSALLG